MKYLVSTNKGNIYHVENDKTQLLLKDDTKSIYTDDESIRFIKKYNNGYLVGKSESILIWDTPGGVFKLPGLVDIKDVIVTDGQIFILSGLRDSVYMLTKDFAQIITCFNINQEGKIEYFYDRQMQCKEVPSSFFQVFYCPRMENINKFDRLTYYNGNLSIHNSFARKYIQIDLTTFNYRWHEHDSIYFGRPNINVKIGGEIITDYIEC